LEIGILANISLAALGAGGLLFTKALRTIAPVLKNAPYQIPNAGLARIRGEQAPKTNPIFGTARPPPFNS